MKMNIMKQLSGNLLILLTLSIICKVNAIAIHQQQFRRTPDNQTATINDKVTLACSIVHKQGVLQWTRDGFGLGTDRNLNGYERYRMHGSEEEGDFTLVIDHVTLEDDAVFQCQVGPGPHGVKELRSANAKLTVEIPTGKPEILQGSFLQTTEDREVKIECVSKGGKPAAEITWLDGNGQEIKGASVSITKELLPDGKRYDTRSTLTLIPKKHMNNKTFTCQAHNHPSKEVTSAFITLNVKYSPKINLIISSNIKEHDNVKIICRAEGNPSEMTYRWSINGQVMSGAYSNLFHLNNISRLYHNNVVKCEVTNSVGKSEASEVLFVQYGPTFLQKLKSIQAEANSSVSLSCLVDGNPKPEVVWYHQETRIVVGTQPNLTIIADSSTAGKYICQAVVQGFAEISDESQLYLKGPPKIQSSKIQFGREGGLARVECFALSIPKAKNVTWSYAGNIVVPGANYSIEEEHTNVGITSTLIIKSTKSADFGPYNCTIRNQYGTNGVEIFLMRQKNPHLLIILTAVIASVVFVAAITMITLLCQKKSSKKIDLMSSDMGENEKNNINMNKCDASSNNSDLKVEIRTASSLSNINEDSEQWNEDHSDILNNKNDPMYHRYSDFIEQSIYPSENDGHNNNGYIPYPNYAPDYNPLDRNGLYPPPSQPKQNNIAIGNAAIDSHFSANYGNPYLRVSNTNLPLSPQINTNPCVGIGNNLHEVNSLHRLSNPIHINDPSHYITNTNSRSNTPAPQVPRNIGIGTPLSLSSTTLQYVPSQMTHHQLKPGTLATHV